MKHLLFVIALLLASPVAAQDRPIAGSTLQSTDTSANSLLVGCAVGSTTCTGGIKANTITPVSALTVAGTLTVTGFGTHLFSAGSNSVNVLKVENTTSNTTAWARVNATAGTTVGFLDSYSQGYTTGSYDVQAATALVGQGAGGLSIAAADASGAIRFYTGGTTQRFGINTAGDWLKGSSIMDSTGTPTISSGFGTGSPTIAGNDYAFKVSTGTGASTTGVVNFGRTWTTAPVCSITSDSLGDHAFSSITTTSASLTYPSVSSGTIWVLCRSY